MHVAIAMFTAVWIDVLLREMRAPRWPRAVNALWFLAITVSTVAIRQHVVVDAAAGALLGASIAFASLTRRPRGGAIGDRGVPRAIIAGSSSTASPITVADPGRLA
jgi:membrane-associated phospholipid phosphatase